MKTLDEMILELFNLSRGVASAGFTTSKSRGATMKDDEKDGLGDGGRAEKFPGGRPQLADPKDRPEMQDRDETEFQQRFMKEDPTVQAERESGVKGALEKASALLFKKKGIDVNKLTKLGQGTFGVAYDIGDGKVLKITRDKLEAITSHTLVGKSYPSIVKIFDVFKFKDGGAKPYYGLIQEKLTKLTNTEKDAFDVAVIMLYEVLGLSSNGAPGRAFVDLKGSDWDSWKDFIREEAQEGGNQDIAEDALDGLESVGMKDIADDLHAAGVKFLDYHVGNIMKRGSQFVIIDLGLSQVAGGGQEPPVLEKKKLKEEAEPDIAPAELGDNPEEQGYNEDGFKLEDRYRFQDLPISIEQSEGSSREWTDPDGNSGSTTMAHAYGYVEGCEGADGDAVDVYIGPNEKSEWVYVIHQLSTPEFVEFDEDKCMLGFDSEEDAKAGYLKHYDKEDFYGGMSVMKMDEFKKKLI